MSKSDPGLLVLASLAGGDKHGYAIMMDVEAFAGVQLGPGTLYGAIARLEECGFIRAVGARNERRQPYRLTPSGRRHLATAMASLEALVRVGNRRLRPA